MMTHRVKGRYFKENRGWKEKEITTYDLVSYLLSGQFVPFAVLLTELVEDPQKLKEKEHKRSQLESGKLTLQSGYEDQCISYANLGKMKSVLN